MGKIIKTWWLRTKDGREVFRDPHGNATLSGLPNMGFEFIEGQHPDDDKELLAKKASERLGVECVWKEGPDWTEDIYGRPGNVPPH